MYNVCNVYTCIWLIRFPVELLFSHLSSQVIVGNVEIHRIVHDKFVSLEYNQGMKLIDTIFA